MEKFIKINDKSKIRNPLTIPGYEEQYEGSIDDFSFKQKGLNQLSNFEKINLSLIQFNTKLSYIWSCNFIEPRFRTIFVAKSDDNNFFWHKYEAASQGSGQNYIFIKGNKFKLTNWLSLNDEERFNLWNQV